MTNEFYILIKLHSIAIMNIFYTARTVKICAFL